MTVASSTGGLSPARAFPKEWLRRPRLFTLCTTFRCNLACDYCYVRKHPARMTLETARRALDFIFRQAGDAQVIDIGFFGGEPLLEFTLMRQIVRAVEEHPGFQGRKVSFTLTTNGTLLSGEGLDFLREHAFKVCVSCDGAPRVQDLHRHAPDGKGSSALVERNLATAQTVLGDLAVNAVYTPRTLRYLPESVAYFSSLGVRHISLSPDFTAVWAPADLEQLPSIYQAVAEQFKDWYRAGDPHYIDLIDNKLSVLTRGGYHPLERCMMGVGELTITPDGGLYPCERLVGSGSDGTYRIGTIESGVDLSRMAGFCAGGGETNPECRECSMRDYCVNWCGCSNLFMTGYTNRVGPFLCASERAAIGAAARLYAEFGDLIGPLSTCDPAGRTGFYGNR